MLLSLFSHACSHSLSFFGGPGCSGLQVQDNQHGRHAAGEENLESLKQGTIFSLHSSSNLSHLTQYCNFFQCSYEPHISGTC